MTTLHDVILKAAADHAAAVASAAALDSAILPGKAYQVDPGTVVALISGKATFLAIVDPATVVVEEHAPAV